MTWVTNGQGVEGKLYNLDISFCLFRYLKSVGDVRYIIGFSVSLINASDSFQCFTSLPFFDLLPFVQEVFDIKWDPIFLLRYRLFTMNKS